MKLTWSAYALSDSDAIFTYIEADNPAATALIDERIIAAVRRLLDFPASGRVTESPVFEAFRKHTFVKTITPDKCR